jgi:hypothetical protein
MARSMADAFFSTHQQMMSDQRARQAEDEADDLANSNATLRRRIREKNTKIDELTELLEKRNKQVNNIYKAYRDQENFHHEIMNRYSESTETRLSEGLSYSWLYITRNASRQFLAEFNHQSTKPWGIDEARVYNLTMLFAYGLARDLSQGVRHIFDWLTLTLDGASKNLTIDPSFAEALQEQVVYHRKLIQNKNVYELAKARTREALQYVKFETCLSTFPTLESLKPALPLVHFTEFDRRVGTTSDQVPFEGSDVELDYNAVPSITFDGNLRGLLLPTTLPLSGIIRGDCLPYPDLFELGSTLKPTTPTP